MSLVPTWDEGTQYHRGNALGHLLAHGWITPFDRNRIKAFSIKANKAAHGEKYGFVESSFQLRRAAETERIVKRVRRELTKGGAA